MKDAFPAETDFAGVLELTDTEELRRLLREDLETVEPVRDRGEDPVTAILETVIQREAGDPSVPHLDVEAGWAELWQRYLPRREEPAAPGEQTA